MKPPTEMDYCRWLYGNIYWKVIRNTRNDLDVNECIDGKLRGGEEREWKVRKERERKQRRKQTEGGVGGKGREREGRGGRVRTVATESPRKRKQG